MEEYIMKRIEEISNAYAELEQLNSYDLTLESIGDKGDVSVTLKKDNITFERTIGYKEPLDFITETFTQTDTFTPQSKDMCLKGLKGAYFGKWNDLLIEKEGIDGVAEILRVKESQREKVIDVLKEKLGHKFAKPAKKVPAKQAKKQNLELMWQIYYTLDGKENYFIVSSDTESGAKATALDMIKQRGLDIKENKIFSKFINN